MKPVIIVSAYFLASFYMSAHAESTSVSALHDPQIAGIVKTANNTEIEAAKVARATATNDRVRGFANMMVDHHSQNNTELDRLASRIAITPIRNNIADDIATSSKKELDYTQNLTGATYDRAYMDSQIAAHQEVLRDIDQKLIPNSSNGELRKMLEETRGTVANHLAQAEDIRASL